MVQKVSLLWVAPFILSDYFNENRSSAISASMGIVYALANTWRKWYHARMDEGRKRVIGIMAAILASLHMQTADDLFGTPQGSPRTDKLIAASSQWAREIMKKIDAVCGRS